jgi:hypothetical protein
MLALLLNRWVQFAAGSAVALVLGFGLGHHQKTLEDASAALRGAKATVVQIGKQEGVSTKVGTSVAASQAHTQTVTQTLIQRVPYAVPKATACPVSVAALSVLNDAASNTVSDSAAQSADAASGVDTADLAANYVLNSGQYHQIESQLNGWIDWYEAQKALAEGR